jgi:hypothetical protein
LKYFDKESEEGLLLIYQCEVGVGQFYKFPFKKKEERDGTFYCNERKAKLPEFST